jgi:hypothetical protein
VSRTRLVDEARSSVLLVFSLVVFLQEFVEVCTKIVVRM